MEGAVAPSGPTAVASASAASIYEDEPQPNLRALVSDDDAPLIDAAQAAQQARRDDVRLPGVCCVLWGHRRAGRWLVSPPSRDSSASATWSILVAPTSVCLAGHNPINTALMACQQHRRRRALPVALTPPPLSLSL